MSCCQEPTLEYTGAAAQGPGQEQSWPLVCLPLLCPSDWLEFRAAPELIPLPCTDWVRPNPWINLPGAIIHVEQLGLAIGTVSIATSLQQVHRFVCSGCVHFISAGWTVYHSIYCPCVHWQDTSAVCTLPLQRLLTHLMCQEHTSASKWQIGSALVMSCSFGSYLGCFGSLKFFFLGNFL